MSRFISDIEELQDHVCVSVHHEYIEEDPSIGSNQVVNELRKFVEKIGLKIGRNKIRHSEGFACVYIKREP